MSGSKNRKWPFQEITQTVERATLARFGAQCGKHSPEPGLAVRRCP
jgi:hypothetical protein